ncbi:sigma-70 family RNA polymerase sigma factor [Nocardia rhamnosiphila]|uniref:RNA polymerase sigma factor n=1 Tax=Nocardia rhamnosiphila TaxID=426716 RepID=UPI003404C06C
MHNTSPDWAALYQAHRRAMFLKARQVLHEAGLVDQAMDVVQDAFESLLKSPPTEEIHNWEAFLVKVAGNKATDRLRSAAFRHSGPELDEQEHDISTAGDLADEVAEAVDDRRAGAQVWDALAVLNVTQRKVAWEYLALQRPRKEVAEELRVTPARVSQIASKAAELLRAAIERGQVADE